MLFIGLDVHLRGSNICILEQKGDAVKVTKEFQVRGPRRKVIETLGKLKRPFKVCYEASCGYGYLHRELSGMAEQIQVAHPGQLRLIFKSKRKNDRVDAKKLATLLLLEQVPEVYVPSVDVQGWRALIEFRRRTVGKRTQTKNALRALFRNHGIEVASGKALWTRRGRASLSAAVLPTRSAAVQRDMLLEELKAFDEKIKRIERELDAIAEKHPGVYLLRTIPGVGPRTAEAVVAYIDDPGRFSRNKQVGCYMGLVPCQDQSLKTDRLGHITREGPATVRKFLVEAAWQGIRRSPRIRAYFERVQKADPVNRKKIALVATAHYLVRVMHAMLRSGEVWREESTQKQVA